MPTLTMLSMILLCTSLFPLSHDTSPPVVYMDMLKSSTSRLETSVDFSKALSSSTLTYFHGCCSVFNVLSMKLRMHTGDCLDAVVNTHIIVAFAPTAVIMEVNPRVEVTL